MVDKKILTIKVNMNLESIDIVENILKNKK